MKKKLFVLVLLAVMTLGLFAGCAKQEEFVVGFDASFPPYGYVENGEYVGFDIDLAKEVAKRNGWNIKLQAIDWNSKDFELNSGTISCIWNGFTMNGREDKYTWTRAYVDNSQVVVVKADSGINELSDLAGKTVAVQDDSSALAVLTNTEDNDEMLALALIENLQRSDLNPVEEAKGYRQLIDASGMTQEEVAEKLGVTSQAVSKWENNNSHS